MSYLQQSGSYNSYQSRVLSNYADTPPPLTAPSLAQTPGYGMFASGANITPQNQIGIQEENKIYSLVIDLMEASTRESALLELSKRREQYDDLALVLWHSFGKLVDVYTLRMELSDADVF